MTPSSATAPLFLAQAAPTIAAALGAAEVRRGVREIDYTAETGVFEISSDTGQELPDCGGDRLARLLGGWGAEAAALFRRTRVLQLGLRFNPPVFADRPPEPDPAWNGDLFRAALERLEGILLMRHAAGGRAGTRTVNVLFDQTEGPNYHITQEKPFHPIRPMFERQPHGLWTQPFAGWAQGIHAAIHLVLPPVSAHLRAALAKDPSTRQDQDAWSNPL